MFHHSKKNALIFPVLLMSYKKKETVLIQNLKITLYTKTVSIIVRNLTIVNLFFLKRVTI